MNDILMPILTAIGLGLITWVGSALVKLVPEVMDLIIAKVGTENYNSIKAVAWDIFNKVEEDSRTGDMLKSKVAIWESMMRTRFPYISQADLNLLNKAIAGEFNKDKPLVVAAANSPQVEAPATPLGNEAAVVAAVVAPIVASIPEPVVAPVEQPAAVVEPITVTVTPTYKYQTPDGTPLMEVPAITQ